MTDRDTLKLLGLVGRFIEKMEASVAGEESAYDPEQMTRLRARLGEALGLIRAALDQPGRNNIATDIRVTVLPLLTEASQMVTARAKGAQDGAQAASEPDPADQHP